MTEYSLESLKAHAPYLSPAYVATRLRSPKRPLIVIPQTLTELSGPVYGHERVTETDSDLTRQHASEPLGERIIVSGRVTDEDGRPIPDTLIELWQANSAGRYIHIIDRHPAPIDPNFTGAGRCVTDAAGRYRFTTIKPGAYPWENHHNAWRPNHIHFSLFGPSFLTRLVTQMYFPGDPLIPLDPIAQAVGDPEAVERMIAKFDLDTTLPSWALGYRFDIVLRGRHATPFEEIRIMSETDVGEIGLTHEPHDLTPSQTVGPYFAFSLTPGTRYAYTALAGSDLVTGDTIGEVIEIVGRITDGDGAGIPDAMIEIWQADGAGRLPGSERRANATFRGFGRSETADGGTFSFRTVKPGPLPGPDGRMQAPHIDVGVFARGIVRRLFTRIYFADEPANATDAILALVPAERHATLIAAREAGSGPPRYRFDIRVQGDDETVFFEA